MTLTEWAKIRHFTRSEFICNCCGIEHMNFGFMQALDELRDGLDFPFVVSSGYRCPAHNDRVSSTGHTGPHTTGRAVDIKIYGELAYRLVTAATGGPIRFTGIGLKQTGHHLKRFVHLDDLAANDSRNRPWIWTY